VISLGAGEPTSTPGAHQGSRDPRHPRRLHKYTEVDGTPSLKQAVIAKFKRDNGSTTAGQILVSVGGKQSFFNLAQALLEKGDEVVIPAPYWVSYPDMVLLADGAPVIISTGIQQGYKISPEQLDAVIGFQTKLVVINSPSNPTGAVYTRKELEALGEVLRKYPTC